MEVKDIISSGLLELYVTGAATQQESLQVEQWADQYPEVKKELEDLQDVMENYAMAQAVQPDEELKEKILAKLKPAGSVKEKIFSRIQTKDPVLVTDTGNEREAEKIFSIPSYFKWAVAASIILLVGSLVFNYIFYTRYRNASNELLTAQQQMDRQQQLASSMDTAIKVMTDKYAVPVLLNGTEKSPDALAKIFWMKNTGDVYVDPTNLPQAPSGMQYQLWAIVDGKPEDAGMIALTIDTKKGTYHLQRMKSFGKVQAFAITMEKAGGNPTPKGDMIVQAKI